MDTVKYDGRSVCGSVDHMAKKMLIDATHAEETRVVVVDGNKVEEFDFESENRRQLAGNIYLAKVTRVEPSLQAAFVDYGGNRHGFLAFSEIHPDYYQIPVADREDLMEEERAYAEEQKALEEAENQPKRRTRRRRSSKAQDTTAKDAVETREIEASDVTGMETIDLDDDSSTESLETGELVEGVSDADQNALDTASDAPVEEASSAGQDAVEAENAEPQNAEVTDNVEADTAPDSDVANDATSEDMTSEVPDDDDDAPVQKTAAEKEDSIEAVSDDDDILDLRPRRKPRPRRYKIQEVIKVRQILLVQVVKEERGNKGAALTTYLSLAGRYCVLMPNTARGGGISRKITNANDRKKLKEIASEIDVPTGAGLIVRTAGAKRTKTEIKRDYEYLQRMWEQVRELTLKSIAPAKIYEEGDLIKRTIRDLYNREIDEVLVEGERGYRIAKDFMKMIMPSHAKNVKHYTDAMPLFARYQVESYLSSMFNPVVQLKSGGYIVIGITEALVAVDVNSGRATKEGSIEETALKTNLEAAEEVARQMRLRDLAGLIVIDFIDMDERKNNAAVEKRLKDKLKTDRARIQVGRISGFGLLEMSRQRLRPGMLEATTQPCPHCHGTGLIRSEDNLALSILRQIEEEGVRRRSKEVLVKCPVSIANYLMNQKREHIAQIEQRYGLSVRIEADMHLISPDFEMEKFKTATRFVPEAVAPVVSVDASLMDQIDEEAALDTEQEVDEVADETATDEEQKPKRRRRRRRRKKSDNTATAEADTASETGTDVVADAPSTNEDAQEETVAPDSSASDNAEHAVQQGSDVSTPVEEEEAPKPKKRTRTRKKPVAQKAEDVKADAEQADAPAEDTDAVATVAETPAEEEAKPEKPKRKRAPRKTKAQKDAETAAAAEATAQAEAVIETKVDEAPEPVEATPAAPLEVVENAPVEEPVQKVAEPVADPKPEVEPTPVQVEPTPVPEPVAVDTAEVPEKPVEDPNKPKRRGWWSLGR